MAGDTPKIRVRVTDFTATQVVWKETMTKLIRQGFKMMAGKRHVMLQVGIKLIPCNSHL